MHCPTHSDEMGEAEWGVDSDMVCWGWAEAPPALVRHAVGSSGGLQLSLSWTRCWLLRGRKGGRPWWQCWVAWLQKSAAGGSSSSGQPAAVCMLSWHFVIRSSVCLSMLCILLSLKTSAGESGNEWAVLEREGRG